MHIHHIDTRSGTNSRSTRETIDADARALGPAMLDAALSPDGAAVPWAPGLGLRAIDYGKCLAVDVLRDGAQVARLGIAAHSRCGATMWREMLTDSASLGDPSRQPRAPWCARASSPGAMADDVAALAGIERAIAWAWLDHLEDRRNAG